MDDNSFELIMQEILHQKQRMEELIAENEELRRQLAELREGRGIFIEILGKQFALAAETTLATQDASRPQSASASFEAPESRVATEVSMSAIPETPRPETTIEELVHQEEEEEEEASPATASTFLEELLVDEFASAVTSPMTVWKRPGTRKLPPIDEIDEEQKAALRKELIGSFLLE